MTDVQIAAIVEPSFGENAYVIWRRDGGACWIVDPGLPPSAAQLIAHVRDHELAPEALVLTHGHADHIAGVPEIRDAYADLPILIAEDARPAFTDPAANLSSGLGLALSFDVGQTRDLPPGTTLSLEGTSWQVLDTSGHSPGGRSFFCAEAGLVIVGDALFQQSIGRTDFPHSDHDTLIRNIKEKLLTLPEETKVYSGHGPMTTIGDERRFNPYL